MSKSPGKNYSNWFWAADPGKYAGGQSTPAASSDTAGKGEPVSIDNELNQMLVDNAKISAPTWMNLLKSKGMKVVKEAEQSSSAAGIAVSRAGAYVPYKKKKKAKHIESSSKPRGKMNFRCEFLESTSTANPTSQTRFKVVLIQEGLGNLKDGYYYSKEALKSALPIFEGKKMYADHPSRIDEESRPERSVRDIIGHFEGVQYMEAEDGAGRLEADVVVLPDEPFQWARALMRHAIDYSKAYPDKDFIGLSINAAGNAFPIPAADFVKESNIPESARVKIDRAIQEGLNEIKVVKQFEDAVSVDLVTEAGAKGRVLQLLEADKMMDEKKKEAMDENKEGFGDGQKEQPEKKDDAEKPAEEKEDAAAQDGAHDDEAQDVELFKKLLKQHLGDEAENDESAMKAAKHYTAAFQKEGHEKPEAMKRAVEAMKCSGSVHEAMEAEESEAKKEAEEKKMEASKEDECKKESDDKKMESEMLRLKGENAKLREALAKIELTGHLDKTLKESGLPMAVTKKFRESVSVIKSKKEIDDKFKIFMEGYKFSSPAGDGSVGFTDAILNSEKQEMREGDKASINFSDCTT